VANIVVLRKSYYYARHYVSILFLMTTCAFSAFTVEASEIETRSNIIFSLLLTIVAFNYSCSDSIPTVPYATVFEQFINCNFLMVILVGGTVFAFSWFYFNKNAAYDAFVESAVGFTLFGIWILGNASYWSEIYARKLKFKHILEHDEQLGWLVFKTKTHQDKTAVRAVWHEGTNVKPQVKWIKQQASSVSMPMASSLRRRFTSDGPGPFMSRRSTASNAAPPTTAIPQPQVPHLSLADVAREEETEVAAPLPDPPHQ